MTFVDQRTSVYMEVLMDLYEAFVFSSFFLLLSAWIYDAEREQVVDGHAYRESEYGMSKVNSFELMKVFKP